MPAKAAELPRLHDDPDVRRWLERQCAGKTVRVSGEGPAASAGAARQAVERLELAASEAR
jgi:hypothetical protein